jgi:hypothetical protein
MSKCGIDDNVGQVNGIGIDGRIANRRIVVFDDDGIISINLNGNVIRALSEQIDLKLARRVRSLRR